MPSYEIKFIDVAWFSSSASTFHSNTGANFQPGDTLRIDPGAVVQTIDVTDSDLSFDDDDADQVLTQDTTLAGTVFAAGTRIESEYQVSFTDPGGTTYRLLAVAMNNNAFQTWGFAFVGPMPPRGTVLTYAGSSEGPQGTAPYAQMAPACFVAGTLIATAEGPRPVESLTAGTLLLTRDHGARPLRLALTSRRDFGPGAHPHKPVLIPAGALGPGLPARDLRVSPQHRMVVNDRDGAPLLVAACALIGRRGIRAMTGARQASYHHLVLDRHEVIFAEGAASESFLPGPMAMAELDPASRAAVLALYAGLRPRPGAQPLLRAAARPREVMPALPILPTGQARRRLARA